MAKSTQDFYQTITTNVIELMEKHGTDWVKPWGGAFASGGPQNFTTKRAYQGVNVFALAIAQYKNEFATNNWGTFKQWQSKGGKIVKGSKSTQIIFFSPITKKVDNSDGTEDEITFGMYKTFNVFNLDQVSGVELPAVPVVDNPTPFDPCDHAERFITASGAICRDGGDKAFYAPGPDYIQMPPRENFFNQEGYYSTKLHELTHWTGHKSRLDRMKGSAFGSNAYAFEELIAELGATFACAHVGIAPEPCANHAKYLNSWIKGLKENKKAFAKAAAQAQKACELLIDYELENAVSEAA